jgi:hypothetical protein
MPQSPLKLPTAAPSARPDGPTYTPTQINDMIQELEDLKERLKILESESIPIDDTDLGQEHLIQNEINMISSCLGGKQNLKEEIRIQIRNRLDSTLPIPLF